MGINRERKKIIIKEEIFLNSRVFLYTYIVNTDPNIMVTICIIYIYTENLQVFCYACDFQKLKLRILINTTSH